MTTSCQKSEVAVGQAQVMVEAIEEAVVETKFNILCTVIHTCKDKHSLLPYAQTKEYHRKKEYRAIQRKPSSFVALNLGADHTNARTKRKIIKQQFEVCITLHVRGYWNAGESPLHLCVSGHVVQNGTLCKLFFRRPEHQK